MSINGDISVEKLLHDLLMEDTGDEMTNRVRQLVKANFDMEFVKLPYLVPNANEDDHFKACEEMGSKMIDSLTPLQVGGVYVDGMVVVQWVNELLAQIRGGGNRFNMVTATEALVSNMAAEVYFFHSSDQ
jgi:hypothetical protein